MIDTVNRMRHVHVVMSVSFLSYLILAADPCRSDAPFQPETKTQAMNTETIQRASASTGTVSLQVEYQAKGDQLEVRYAVSNGEQKDIYLFNRLVRTSADGSGKVDPNLVYTTFESGSVACIAKSLQELPAGLQVTQIEIPYLTRLAPGKQFKETIRIDLPLTEHHPYRGMLRDARGEVNPKVSKQSTVTSLQFELGFLVWREDMAFVDFTENEELLYSLKTPFDALNEQKILRTKSVPLDLTAIVPDQDLAK